MTVAKKKVDSTHAALEREFRGAGAEIFHLVDRKAKEPIDERPIIQVDSKGVGPEIVTRNLADYLSLSAYATVWDSTPQEWAEMPYLIPEWMS